MIKNKKQIIIAIGILLTIAITAFIAFSNDPKTVIEESKKIEFVFNDDYFGKKKEAEKIKLNDSIFTESKTAIKKQKIETKPIVKAVKTLPLRPTNSFNSKIITYKKADNNLAFLSDKDNPSIIASRQYDLSRIITINKYIPAVLETAVNSEIPGTVTARVENDVYGYHAKDVLIPAGSSIIGEFEVMQKHSRKIQIAWHTIITPAPNSRIIKMDSSSLDSHGASGFKGYLDQRLKDRYGAALFFSGLNTLANLSVDVQSVRQLALLESMTRQLVPLTNQVIKENLDVLPVIQIRQGQRFNIIPHQNIIFKDVDDLTIKALFI